MDRTWMYNRAYSDRHRLKDEFVCGVKKFVKKALNQPICKSEEGIRCSCINCKCCKISTTTNVRLHLYRDGFQPDYWIWTQHGEVELNIDTRGVSLLRKSAPAKQKSRHRALFIPKEGKETLRENLAKNGKGMVIATKTWIRESVTQGEGINTPHVHRTRWDPRLLVCLKDAKTIYLRLLSLNGRKLTR
ncbi:unnamed protein product [Lathyrus sativus]|nr:unnamed protein product [Lathyrus sativus]